MARKRWNSKQGDFVIMPAVEEFLAEVIAVARKHGISLAHEDSHGAFIVRRFREADIEWLSDANWED